MQNLRILSLAWCLLALSCSRAPQQTATSTPASEPQLPTLSAFEGSPFCGEFACRKTWQPGEESRTKHTYALTGASNVTAEVQTTEDGRTTAFTLAFGERQGLSQEDLLILDALLRNLHPAGDLQEIRQFVESSTKFELRQIRASRRMRFGSYVVRAGKISGQPTVMVERETGREAPGGAP